MFDLQAYLDVELKKVKLETPEPIFEEYDIGQEIRELLISTRTELELTQGQLAQKAGLHQSRVSKIESGAASPNIATIRKLADAMGVRLVVSFIPREEW